MKHPLSRLQRLPPLLRDSAFGHGACPWSAAPPPVRFLFRAMQAARSAMGH